MERYIKTIRVSDGDLDDLDHVNNVRYVQWIQDVSREHWQAVVPKALSDQMVWVVRHHDIHYKSSAVLYDVVRVETYIAETRGALSVRVVEMSLERTGTPLLHSRTSWCLLDAKTQKPVRITQDISNLFTAANNPHQ